MNVTEKATDAVRGLLGQPVVGAYQRHCLAVVNGEIADEPPERSVLERARRYQRHFVADVERLRKRKQAVADLKEADKIQAQADAVKIPLPTDYGAVKMANMTVAERFVALQRYERSLNPQRSVTAEKLQRHDLRIQAQTLRSSATAILMGTADKTLADERAAIAEQRRSHEAAIARIAEGEAVMQDIQRLRDKLYGPDELSPMRRHDMEQALAAKEKHAAVVCERNPAKARAKHAEALAALDQKDAAVLERQYAFENYQWVGD